jgi:BON domain
MPFPSVEILGPPIATVAVKEISMEKPFNTFLRRFSLAKPFVVLPIAVGVLLTLVTIAGCKNQQSVQPTAVRTDQQLTGDIQAKIQGESALAGQNIQVSVANGIATLSGTVSDEASRSLAGNDSGSVNGVKTVVNNLTVQAAEKQPAPAPAPAEPRKPAIHHDRRPAQAQEAPAPQPLPAPQPVSNTPPQQAEAPPPAPPAPPKPVTQQYTLDSGTVVPVTITEALDSKTAQPNDAFHATLASDLVSNGVVVIPRGAPVMGRVVDVHEAAHFKGSALLTIELTQVTARGRKVSLVTDTYSKEGQARGKNTAMKAGGGAVLGAIIGAIAGGGKGAAIGAAAGAGAGTGVNAVTRGEQAQIDSETRLEFRLQSPVTVSITTTPGARQPYVPNSEPSLQQR